MKILYSVGVSAFLLSIMLICMPHPSAAADLTSWAPPNILFTIDMSGTMAWQAYSYNDTDNNGDGVLDNYNAGVVYEGYFDPQKSYKLVNGIYEETVSTGVPCTTSCSAWKCYSSNIGGCDARGTHGCTSVKYACCASRQTAGDCDVASGNYLNYAIMTKVDILRWALTGGRPASCNLATDFQGPYCEPETWADAGNLTKVGAVCNDSLDVDGDGVADGGCVLQAEDNTEVKVRWERILGINPVTGVTGSNYGLLYRLARMPIMPRLGAMFFDGTGVRQDKVYLGDFVYANSKMKYSFYNLITMVNSQEPSGSTATGPALWDVFNYFAMKYPQYGGFSPQTGSGDKWKNPQYVCPSFGISDCVYQPYADNYVLLLSDGQWNAGGNPGAVSVTCSIDAGMPNYSADPVVPAYLMHEGFTNIATNVVARVRSTYAIGLFMNGPGALAMQNVAMYGSFDTSANTWPGYLTGYPQATCTVSDCSSAAKGSLCTDLPASWPDWDANADGVPDTFFNGNNATEIKDSLMSAMLDMVPSSLAIRYLVWQDDTYGNNEIFLKNSTDGGVTWQGPYRVTDNITNSQNPSLATDGMAVYIAWQDDVYGNNEILVKKSIDNGITWAGPYRVTSNTGNSQNPSLISTGGALYLAWQDDTYGNNEIFVKKSTDGGATWQGPYRVTNNTGNSQNAVLISDSGVLYLAWQDDTYGNNEIFVKKSMDGGVTWLGPYRVTNNSGNSQHPMLVADNGTLYLAWQDDTYGNNEIFVKKSTDNGVTWQGPYRVTNNTTNSQNPALATDGTALYVAWQDDLYGNNEILVKKSTDGGVTWAGPYRVTSNNGNSQNPALLYDGTTMYITWQDDTYGNNEIFVKKSANGVGWQGPYQLTSNSGESLRPKMK